MSIPRAGSLGEETLALHLRAHGIDYEREVVFAPGRKFRFDFVVGPPEVKLAVEVDGGTRTFGRHSRHGGITSDCEKYNLAVRLGYRVLRYTTEMVTSGTAIDEVRALLKASTSCDVPSGPQCSQLSAAAIDTSASGFQ